METRLSTAIVMSRRPRLVVPNAPWLLGLRACLRRIRDRGERLLIGDATAGCEFVRRGAQLLNLDHTQLRRGEHSVADQLEPSHSINVSVEIPERDRLLAIAAGELLVLEVRSNGHWHRLLSDRLKAGRGGVTLVDVPALEGEVVRRELLSLGAVRWAPGHSETESLWDERNDVIASHHKHASPNADLSPAIVELVPFPSADGWVSLSHTTRGCPGPWPEQSHEDYFDSLLCSHRDADHSALGTLERILRQRRLIASTRTARGGVRVVSFTASPLSQLPELRRFRRHRGRWDFEPYGLCIHQSWLKERGVRPVVYGNEANWRDLNEHDQSYFQLAHSLAVGANETDAEHESAAGIDWTVEREWRHIGHLDLRELPRESGLVFVRNYAAAKRVSIVSPWPVTLWPDPMVEVIGY